MIQCSVRWKWQFLFLLYYAFITACNYNAHSIPFPENENSEIEVPGEPFSYDKAEQIEWLELNKDSLKSLRYISKYDLKTLEQSKLIRSETRSMPAPIDEKKLEWDTTVHFNLDTMPEQKYDVTYSVLGVPKRVKIEWPVLTNSASENILPFGAEQGLPNLSVNHMIQDHNGNIWMATDAGLCMFDGSYTYVYSTAQGLKGNTPMYLAEDNKGRIWVVYYEGEGNPIDVIDRTKGLILHLNEVGAWKIQFDSKGMAYVSGEGISIIDPETWTYKKIGKNEGIKDGWARGITKPENGILWAAEGSFFFKIDLNKGITSVITDSGFFGEFPDSYTMIAEKGNGVVWAGANWTNTIIGFDEKAGKCYRISTKQGLNEGAVKELHLSANGEIQIASSGGGLFIINLQQKCIRQISSEDGLISNFSQCILEDSSGRLWLGNLRDGAVVFDNKNFVVQNFDKSQHLLNNSQEISGITEDASGNIWTGMRNVGLNLINPDGRVYLFNQQQGLQTLVDFGSLFPDSKGRLWVANYNALNLIDPAKHTVENIFPGSTLGFKPRANIILQDADKNIWLGRTDGIYRMDEKINTIQKMVFSKDKRGFFSTNHLLVENENKIWAATWNGIHIIDNAENKIVHLSGHLLDSAYVNKLYLDSKKRVWALSDSGLFIIDPKKMNFEHFTTAQGLPDDNVLSVIQTQNRYYITTLAGICIMEQASKNVRDTIERWQIYNLGKTSGFGRSDFSGAVWKDHLDNLWFGTGAGITKVSRLKIDTTTSTSVITGVSIMKQPNSFINRDWLLRKLGDNDTLLNVSETTGHTKSSLINDTGYLSANNIKWDSVSGVNELPVNLVLPYNQNSISFSFTSFPYTNWDKVRFRYLLEGRDKGWSESNNQAEAEFQNLSAGKYRLILRSKGLNGKWSNPVYFSFTITPPWWQTWLAYCFYAASLILALVLFMRYRSRKLRTENVLLEELVSKRTTELRVSLEELKSTQSQLIQSEKMASLGELTAGIAHEIQNPLNFVNNFSEVNKELLEELKDEAEKGNIDEVKAIANDVIDNSEKINHHGKRADAIVKGMLQHSKTSTGKKELTDINKLADEYLRLAYHGLRAKDKEFNSEIKTDFDESIDKINIIPQDIGRVLLNLYNNAFYAVNEKGKNMSGLPDLTGLNAQPVCIPTVTVVTKKLINKVEITVTDNGDGIPQNIVDKIFQPFFTTKPTGQGTGLGLSLSYDIIKAHGGEIKVKSKENEGTEFIIQLPLT